MHAGRLAPPYDRPTRRRARRVLRMTDDDIVGPRCARGALAPSTSRTAMDSIMAEKQLMLRSSKYPACHQHRIVEGEDIKRGGSDEQSGMTEQHLPAIERAPGRPDQQAASISVNPVAVTAWPANPSDTRGPGAIAATDKLLRTTWKTPGAERGPYAIGRDRSARLHLNISRANGDAIVLVLTAAASDDSSPSSATTAQLSVHRKRRDRPRQKCSISWRRISA